MKRKLKMKLAAAAALAVGAVGAANAAVDASVSTAFQQIQTDATSLAGTVTPIVVGVLGLVIGIKLVKRFGNKI